MLRDGMMLPFVQLEFAGEIGLPEGRYVSRAEAGEEVLVVQLPGAPRAGKRRRRGRVGSTSETESVPITRVTVVSAQRLEPKQAERWLAEVSGDPEARTRQVRSATRLLNHALHALRAAARDPLIQDVGASRALALRIGFGTGEQVADGRWTEARQLPPPPRSRREEIDPQQRIAAVLGGRDSVEPAETLFLRAQLDLEQERPLEAAYGLDAAEAALADAPGKVREDLGGRIAKLRSRLQG
jgi:hypothetical protein